MARRGPSYVRRRQTLEREDTINFGVGHALFCSWVTGRGKVESPKEDDIRQVTLDIFVRRGRGVCEPSVNEPSPGNALFRRATRVDQIFFILSFSFHLLSYGFWGGFLLPNSITLYFLID